MSRASPMNHYDHIEFLEQEIEQLRLKLDGLLDFVDKVKTWNNCMGMLPTRFFIELEEIDAEAKSNK